MFANLLLTDESGENKGRFHCSQQVLNGMFESFKETENYNVEETGVAQLSRKLIIESLLLIKRVLFSVVKNENVILSMNVS